MRSSRLNGGWLHMFLRSLIPEHSYNSEEQHDDQVLHELLRCLKALSTSSIGCFALRSSCPTPFVQLMSLLYSDKKPGDVATRQLIVELLLLLFELYPPSSLPSHSATPRFRSYEASTLPATTHHIYLPSPHTTLFSLLRALLLTPAPPPPNCPPRRSLRMPLLSLSISLEYTRPTWVS